MLYLFLIFLLVVVLLLGLFWQVLMLRSIEGSPESGRLRLKIEAFTGYGRKDSFFVSGRVFKDGGSFSALDAEFEMMGFAGKFRRNLRRFLLPEINDVAVDVRVGDTFRSTTTDGHGRFAVRFEKGPPLDVGTTLYSVHLNENEARHEASKAVGQILICPETTQLGIISDVDDTIVTSHIRNPFRMLVHTVLTSVSDLLPTPGMAALLTSLSTGKSGAEKNPVFYVSGSPANLHDKLNAFLRANRFPVGPIFLTSIGREPEAGFFRQKIFKTERIRELFLLFPSFRFVLIGDNGQNDPDIYHQIALEFPGRVAATLIYERVPRLQAKKMLPVEQQRMASALDGGIALHQRGLLSKEGLRSIVHDLILAEILPESFDLDKTLRHLERKERAGDRRLTLITRR